MSDLLPFIPLITAIIVGFLGYQVNRRMHLLRESSEYKKFKLEKIQESLDEIIRPREDFPIGSSKESDEILKLYRDYGYDLDYYWQRAEHYCFHVDPKRISEADDLKRNWFAKHHEFVASPSPHKMDELVDAIGKYKKSITYSLIEEARAIVAEETRRT